MQLAPSLAAARRFWICPQGKLLPSHVPLRFKSGLARIAIAALVLVAFRYQFLKNEKPDCWIKIGRPVTRVEETAPHLTRRLEARLQRELDEKILQESMRSS